MRAVTARAAQTEAQLERRADLADRRIDCPGRDRADELAREPATATRAIREAIPRRTAGAGA